MAPSETSGKSASRAALLGIASALAVFLSSCGDQWIGPQPIGDAHIARLARGSRAEPAARLEVTSGGFAFTTSRRVARGTFSGGGLITIDQNDDERGDLVSTALAADDNAVYYAKRKSGVVSIVTAANGVAPDPRPLLNEAGAINLLTSGGAVYVAREGGEILRYQGALTPFSAGPRGPFQIATDQEHVVWATDAAGTSSIASVRELAPSETPFVLATAETHYGGLALDEDTCVFYTDTSAGTVNMVWKEGGDVLPMATGRRRPTWIVFDGDRGEVVWVESATHELYVMSTALSPVGYESPRLLATGLGEVVALRARAGKIYWAEEEGIYALTRFDATSAKTSTPL